MFPYIILLCLGWAGYMPPDDNRGYPTPKRRNRRAKLPQAFVSLLGAGWGKPTQRPSTYG